ncbi:unnamed protein product, partial [Prorocentrum cordatum]
PLKLKRSLTDFSPCSPALKVPEVLMCPVCIDPDSARSHHRERLAEPFGRRENFPHLNRFNDTFEKFTPRRHQTFASAPTLAERALSTGAEQRVQELRGGSATAPAAPTVAEAAQVVARVAAALQRHVMQLVDNHCGPAPSGVQGLDLMPPEWTHATFPVLARLALRHEHSINRLEAASYRRAQMPSKHDVIKAMQLTAKFHGSEAARLRKDNAQALAAGQLVQALEDLGIPHPHVLLALVGALIAQGDKIGQLNLQALKSYMATVNHEKPSDALLADKIHHCRMQTTHTGEFVKLWLKVDPPELENAVVAALVQLGGQHKHGAPPRSHGARVMQVHLDALE